VTSFVQLVVCKNVIEYNIVIMNIYLRNLRVHAITKKVSEFVKYDLIVSSFLTNYSHLKKIGHNS